MKSLLRTVCTILVLAVLTTGPAAEAAEITSELGRFGEVTTWLIIRTSETRLEVDPFETLGGEAKFAAMSDPRLVPHGGRPLEIPSTKPGETLRIGDGVWEGVTMVLPDMPGTVGHVAGPHRPHSGGQWISTASISKYSFFSE